MAALLCSSPVRARSSSSEEAMLGEAPRTPEAAASLPQTKESHDTASLDSAVASGITRAPTPCRLIGGGESPAAVLDARTSFFFAETPKKRVSLSEVEQLEQLRSSLESKSRELQEGQRELQIRTKIVSQKELELEARDALLAEHEAACLQNIRQVETSLEQVEARFNSPDKGGSHDLSASPLIGGVAGGSNFGSPSDPFQPHATLSRTPLGPQSAELPPVVPQQLLTNEVISIDAAMQTEEFAVDDVVSNQGSVQGRRRSRCAQLFYLIIRVIICTALLWPTLRGFSARLGDDLELDPLHAVETQSIAALAPETKCDPCSCPHTTPVYPQVAPATGEDGVADEHAPEIAPSAGWISKVFGAVATVVPAGAVAAHRLR